MRMIIFHEYNYLICLLDKEDNIMWDSLASYMDHLSSFQNPMPYRKKDISTLFYFNE